MASSNAVQPVSDEPALSLQDFNLVAVRVFDEKEPGQQRALTLEFDNVTDFEIETFQPDMLGVEIIDADREMAVAVTEIVGFGAALVDCQFELECRFAVPQIDERETVEIQPVGDFEAECLLIE